MSGIKRKPITTTQMRRNAKDNPEFLETMALLERFEPLMKSLYNSFVKYAGFNTSEDKEDLRNQITCEFLRLKNSFDPRRGVDFPGYIKFHLQHRVYHYVQKTIKVNLSEIPEADLYGSSDDEEFSVDLENNPSLIDEKTESQVELIEAVMSIPWDKIESEPHKQLIRAVLVDRVPLETYAEKHGISIQLANSMVEECCKILSSVCN